MVELRGRTDRTERNAVDLLVGSERITREFAAHVAQRTRTVGIVAAAVLGAGAALDRHLGPVVPGFAAEDDTAPVARLAPSRRFCRGKDDRLLRRAPGPELAAPFGDQRRHGRLVAFDYGSGLDRELRTVADINPSHERIGTFREGVFPLDLEFVVPVADLRAVAEKDLFQVALSAARTITASRIGFVVAAARHHKGHYRQSGHPQFFHRFIIKKGSFVSFRSSRSRPTKRCIRVESAW